MGPGITAMHRIGVNHPRIRQLSQLVFLNIQQYAYIARYLHEYCWQELSCPSHRRQPAAASSSTTAAPGDNRSSLCQIRSRVSQRSRKKSIYVPRGHHQSLDGVNRPCQLKIFSISETCMSTCMHDYGPCNNGVRIHVYQFPCLSTPLKTRRQPGSRGTK